MSTESTKQMLKAYRAIAAPTLFLAGKFTSTPESFHQTETFEIDIERTGEEVAIAVRDIAAGYRKNAADILSNKEYSPPVLKESIPVNAKSIQYNRLPGQNPFDDINFQRKLNVRVLQKMPIPESKIQRARELMASQVLQTGTITMIDSDGTELYTLDYKPKATHFPTTAVTWGTTNAVPLEDLEGLCDVIRADGKAQADEAIFGADAWNNFIQDAAVQALLDNRRMVLGGVAPEQRGQGAKFMGFIEVGDCRLDMWTYSGRYDHQQTGVSTRFVTPDKVIVRATSGRMDATFGAVERLVPIDPRLVPFIPSRMSSAEGGMDMFINARVDDWGENAEFGISSRPLLVPVAIDTFGCITTTQP